MIKVCFLSHHFESPEVFLQSIIKMTPGCKGVWKDMVAVTNPSEADYYIIMDGWNGELPDAKNKAIYFCQHPYTPYSPVHKMWEGKAALLKFPTKYYLNPGEWWINYTYDELMALEYPNKSKKSACVITYQTHHPMYLARPLFMKELIKYYPEIDLDLYGRPSTLFKADEVLRTKYRGALGVEKYNALKGEHMIGKEALLDYQYTVEFDVGPCENYLSERFYDAILLWCYPFYFGCKNVYDFVPGGCELFNQHDSNGEIKKIYQKLLTNPTDYDIMMLSNTRDMLLNVHQTWARVYDIITNLDKYKQEQQMLGIINEEICNTNTNYTNNFSFWDIHKSKSIFRADKSKYCKVIIR